MKNTIYKMTMKTTKAARTKRRLARESRKSAQVNTAMSKSMLKLIDRAQKKGSYASRANFVREAVAQLIERTLK